MTTQNLTPSRRTVLAGGLAIAAVSVGHRASFAAASTPDARRGGRSANGWPVLDAFDQVAVEGSPIVVALAAGVPSTILSHLARRFHYEIDTLRPGDVHGGTTVPSVQVREQSNYLSGTALGIRPGTYPVGQRGNLFPAELRVIEDMVAECDGVVRWGGTLPVPMEGHFQLDLPPTDPKVSTLARRFGFVDTFDSPHGVGAIDASDPARRAKVREFRRRTRR